MLYVSYKLKNKDRYEYLKCKGDGRRELPGTFVPYNPKKHDSNTTKFTEIILNPAETLYF